MPPSTFHLALSTQIHELRKHLLPDPFDPTGLYPSDQELRTLSFRLFSHGAMEHYLESLAKYLTDFAETQWTGHSKTTFPLLSMVAYIEEPIKAVKRTYRRSEFDDRVTKAIGIHRNNIKGNNGIKKKNVAVLLAPLGVPLDEWDPVLLTTLDNFGGLRGGTAHSAVKITYATNPEDELKTVRNIVLGFEVIDQRVQMLATV